MPRLWSQTVRPQRRTANPARQPHVRLQVELLEDRLALSFGAVTPTFIPVPTNAVPVALNVFGDALASAAITQNEIDFFSFTTPVAGAYKISALTPASNLNTVLGVYNALGARLASNNDISFFNRDSRVTVNLPAGAPIFIAISNLNGTPGGAYTFVVDGPVQDDVFEQNDSFAQASNLGALTEPRTFANLVMGDTRDVFRFSLPTVGAATGSVAIAFQHAQGDLDLRLFNANGVLLRRSEGEANGEQISLSGLPAGTYFVQVLGFQGAFNPNYTLNLDPGANPPPSGGGFDIALNLQGLTPSQAIIFEQAAQRWEQIITSDLPDAFFGGAVVDDLLIEASGVPIDGVNNILGQAGPDRFRPGSILPFHGAMEFDTADLAQLEASGQLLSVILHEMGHVLGIGTIWQQKGLLIGAGGFNPRFTGAQATAAFNAIFGTAETSVPVEGRQAGPGSADSHFRESVFGNELMSPFLNSGANPLSRVTIASLADLGYTVNLNAADLYSPPGASFVGQGGGTGTPAFVQGGTGRPFSCGCAGCLAAATAAQATGGVPALAEVTAALELSRLHNVPGGQQAVEVVFAQSGESDDEVLLVADVSQAPAGSAESNEPNVANEGGAHEVAWDVAMRQVGGLGLEETID